MPKAIPVILEWYEVEKVSLIALLRHSESRRNGMQHKYGYKTHNRDTELQSCGAEYAVAKLGNLNWSGSVNTFKAADVGEHTQVRWTDSKTRQSLVVRPDDRDDHVYVLATGRIEDEHNTLFLVHGYLWGHEAKDQKWWYVSGDGRPGCYMVPSANIHPFHPYWYEHGERLTTNRVETLVGQDLKCTREALAVAKADRDRAKGPHLVSPAKQA